jgi:hypothetical protein
MTIAATSSLYHRPTRVFAYLLSPFPYVLWLLSRPIPLVPFFFTGRSLTSGAYVCCLVVVSFVTVLGGQI